MKQDDQSYEDGTRDARLDNLEDRVSGLEPRMSRVERIVYGALGILGLLSYWPTIQSFFSGDR